MRLTLAIIALIFFVRNALLPLAADDFSYAFIWDGDHVGNILYGVSDTIERVNSIDDLIRSQWSHYMTWGGRTPAHTLIQFFIWIGKIYFNVANTLMFVALIFLIARLADVRLSTKNLLWIAFGLWLAVPEWISTMQWLTGACNYLWAGVAQLLFIYFISRPPALRTSDSTIEDGAAPTLVGSQLPTLGADGLFSRLLTPPALRTPRSTVEGGAPPFLVGSQLPTLGADGLFDRPPAFCALRTSDSTIEDGAPPTRGGHAVLGWALPLVGGSGGGARTFLSAPLGLLAGWSNEAGGLATLFVAIALIVQQKKIRADQSVGLIFFLIGFALLIFAPGNFNRLQLSHPDFVLSTALIVDHLFIALQIIFAELILFVPIAILIFKRRPLGSIKTCLAAGLLVPLIMIFSPELPLRSCFMSAIFLMIASTTAFDQINFDPKKFVVPLTVIGVMWTLSIVGSLYSDVSIYRQTQRRLELIDAQRSKELIEVSPLNPTRRLEKILGLRIFGSAAMSIGGDLSSDPLDGHNVTFAKYYGVSAIACSARD